MDNLVRNSEIFLVLIVGSVIIGIVAARLGILENIELNEANCQSRYWGYYQEQRKCLFPVLTGKPKKYWRDAREDCLEKRAGADLLCIHGQEELEFIGLNFKENIWLGGKLMNNTEEIIWVDGSKSSWAAWRPQRPWVDEKRETYVSMRSKTWNWDNNVSPPKKLNYICEWKPGIVIEESTVGESPGQNTTSPRDTGKSMSQETEYAAVSTVPVDQKTTVMSALDLTTAQKIKTEGKIKF